MTYSQSVRTGLIVGQEVALARKFPRGVAQDAITIRGARVSYSSAGHEGAPIILVHGGAADRRDWEQNISVLAASHRVYAPDLAGFGESHRLDISYTLKHFTDFLRDFISALGIGIPFLVGHSLGGRVCLEFARETPNGIAGLVLVAPIGFGGLSIIGKFLGTGAWALFKLTRKRLPYPDLDVKLSDPNLNPHFPDEPRGCVVIR